MGWISLDSDCESGCGASQPSGPDSQAIDPHKHLLLQLSYPLLLRLFFQVPRQSMFGHQGAFFKRSSDADAETVAYVRRVMDEAGVVWQMAELGKVDAGGGGTVAMYMANRNITTLDAGVPVLAMHAPFEVVSKLDCYETYKGMKAVYEAE